jgi:hypothetical protein
LAGGKCTLDGYQSDAGCVERQVQSLYEALKEQGLRYETAPPGLGWDANPDQRVRLPADSLKERAVNCLDAVVLFASLLEASSLDPLILLMPRHAVVGWKESRSGGSMRFLDIADIGRHDFKDACEAGQKSFTESERLRIESAAYLRLDPPTIKDPERFCVLIDVRDVRKRWAVVPF